MNELPAAVTRRVILGAACWALSIAFFVVQAIAQAASARPYSLATNLISDLGITACPPATAASHAGVCSPLHGLVNGTFIVVGLLHTIGAIATRSAWPRSRPTSFGLGLVALAGTGLALAGLAPENVEPGLHTLGALYGIVALNAGMTLLGLGLRRAAPRLGAPALVAGVAGLVGTVLFLSSAAGVPAGAAERIADYPAAAMLVILGAYLLGSAISANAAARFSTR